MLKKSHASRGFASSMPKKKPRDAGLFFLTKFDAVSLAAYLLPDLC